MRPSLRLLSIGLLFASPPAWAQSEVAWTVDCQSGDSCTLARSVEEVSTGRRAATVLFVVTKAGTEFVGAAIPLGTAIEAGVQLVSDDTQTLLPFQVCFPDGCRAVLETTAEANDTLASQATMDLRAFPFQSDKPFSLAVPLDGLAEALAEARDTLASE